ncbi:MAG: trehalase family glycosidase [Phycisphaerae bacterium]
MEHKYHYQAEKLPKVICNEHPEWAEFYDLAWKAAFSNLEYPSKPGWKPQMTCIPGAGVIWQWDSCFMSMFARYSNGQIPGMNNLDNLYRLQRDDGYMSMSYRVETEKLECGERINPPLMAWTEWEYYRVSGNATRLAKVLYGLIQFFQWVKDHRTRSSGLYWFEDTGASGMDNAPRSGYYSEKLNGSDVCFIDLACQQALSALYIEKIAGHLNRQNIAAQFRKEYAQLKELINQMHWCEQFGFYFDLFTRDRKDLRHNFLNHKTLAGFWPMIADISSEHQVDCLVQHLLNPNEFWTPHPLPSLSKDDPNYDPQGGYWLGGVWSPTNYMVCKGLEKYHRHALAREIAVRHIDAMIAVMRNKSYSTFWECYSPEYPQPSTNGVGQRVRPNFVGWTGLSPIALLIETVLGFDCDASRNRITWTLQTQGLHGIENLHFNGKTVSCTCLENEDGQAKIRVETTGEFNLRVRWMDNHTEQDYHLKPGKHELKTIGDFT